MKINFLSPKKSGGSTYRKSHSIVGLCAGFVAAVLIGTAIGSSVLITSAYSASNEILTAPTILSPQPSQAITATQPTITGVTQNSTSVDVYVDGVFNGKATVKNGPQGTASWSYRAFLPLNEGQHIVYTVTRSEDGVLRSSESSHILFTIEKPLPAPTLKQPVVNNTTTYTKPLITGLAHNNSTIEVFIDGALNGTFTVVNHESGIANFAYQPFLDLQPGWHSVNVRAKNPQGKTSYFSNTLTFEVRDNSGVVHTTAPQLPTKNQPEPTNVVAPTLVKPETGTVTTNTRPTVSGLSKADQNATIQVFVDGVLDGETKITKNESGTSGFSYRLFLPLTIGVHQIHTRMVADNGEKSAESNTTAFLIRSADQYHIVTPSGVILYRTNTASGIVKATSTSEEVVSENTTTKPEEKTDNTTQTPSVSTGPDNTNTEITVIDTSHENTEVVPVENNTANTESATSTEIIVIGQNTTSSATSTQGTSRTGIIIALAIAAIIIIGLISWFTSGSQEENTSPESTSHKDSKSADGPTTQDIHTQTWETEPLEDTSSVLDAEQSSSIAPPPPPPSFGI